MAGTDPKNTRANGPASEREEYDADEDPLVELARIVSEDGGFSGRATPRPKVERARPTIDRDDLSSDLEAELLQELETSFSGQPRHAPTPQPAAPKPAPRPARAPSPPPPPTFAQEIEPEPEPEFAPEREPAYAPEPVAPPRPVMSRAPERAAPPEPDFSHEVEEPDFPLEPEVDAPVYSSRLVRPNAPESIDEPEPVPPGDDPEHLLRSIEEQLNQFDHRVRTHGFGGAGDASEQEEALAAWMSEEPVHPAAEPEPEPEWPEEPAREPEAPRAEYRFRGPAGSGWDAAEDRDEAAPDMPQAAPAPAAKSAAAHHADLAGQLRGMLDAVDEEDVEAKDERRSEPPAEADEDDSLGAYGEAEEPSYARPMPELTSLEDELSQEFEPTYAARGTHEPEDLSDDDLDEAEDEELEPHVATVIAPEHGMRPPPRPAAPPQKRSGRGMMMTAAAALVVVAIGAAGAYYYRSLDQGASGPPPVIAADDGPVKIEPAQEQADSGVETVGEAVYDRVAGRAPAAEENVVEGAEEPREIARIVLPQSGENSDGPPPTVQEAQEMAAGSEAPATAETEGSAEEFGPRRVPTYVVRPDGTIVATAEAGPPSEADLSAQEMATAQTEAMDPKPVATVTIDEPRTAGTPAVQQGPVLEPATTAATTPAAPPAEEPVAPETELADLRQTEEEPAPLAEPAPAAEEQQVVVAPAPEPEPAPAPTAASGFVVQISSQTSQSAAEATFASLQSRYPSILGNLNANIQRADLGDKGVFYRVRVGPWAERSSATEVCETLKAAGGDCFVAR